MLDVESAFPAPLADALAAWSYMLDAGFEPQNIMLFGDSAGGHLCLYLAQYLAYWVGTPQPGPADRGRPLALPGGMALSSPLADMTLSFPTLHGSRDYLYHWRLDIAKCAALRHYVPQAARDPLFSPALAPAGHWAPFAAGGSRTRVFLSYGEDEALAGEDRALEEGMRADGVDLDVYVEPDGLHCGPMAPWSVPSVYETFASGVKRALQKMA